jgi:hypothetical protein
MASLAARSMLPRGSAGAGAFGSSLVVGLFIEALRRSGGPWRVSSADGHPAPRAVLYELAAVNPGGATVAESGARRTRGLVVLFSHGMSANSQVSRLKAHLDGRAGSANCLHTHSPELLEEWSGGESPLPRLEFAGVVCFASDQGAHVLVLDLDDRWGFGPGAVYAVARGAPSVDFMVFWGPRHR